MKQIRRYSGLWRGSFPSIGRLSLPRQLDNNSLNRKTGWTREVRTPFMMTWNPMVSTHQAFAFCSEKSNVRKYQASHPEEKAKQSGNSSLEARRKRADKFIERIFDYSNYLKMNKPSPNGSSGSVMPEQSIAAINSHFIEAGTTAEQISVSLAQIAVNLKKILIENQEKSISLKNRARYEQFLKLFQDLDQKYYKDSPLKNNGSPIDIALFLLDLECQLASLCELLNNTLEQLHPNYTPDITNDEAFSKNFHYAWRNMKIKQLDPATKAAHDTVYNLLRKSVIMVTHAVITEHTFSDWDNQYWRKILFGLAFPVSLMGLKRAELKCYKLWRKPTIQMAKNLLDLPEKGYIQHAKKVIYPAIKSNFFLYTRPASKTGKESTEEATGKETSFNIFEKAEHSGRILLNSHQNLQFKGSKPLEKFLLLKRIFSFPGASTPSAQPSQQETVIIHIHGGGFISMSSELMQNHTRRWANELHIPVFSLDYRKPPKHRFPEPLDDCVAGYKFIVEQIHHHMNIRPKNVILAGDSAGGNLACAVTAQLMKESYQLLPKGLFLMYPAVDLRIRYTASRLQSFSDGIFRPSLLMLCQKEYLGEDRKNQFNPLASPILLKQSFINPAKEGTEEGEKWPVNWPLTVIFSGRKDPLFDDSIRLLQRLSRDSHDCKMLLYKDFSHGFMSMDQVLPGAKDAIKDSIVELRDMITKIESQPTPKVHQKKSP